MDDIHHSHKGLVLTLWHRYDELVRHFRPPGNLSTPIPACIGIKFSVGKLLERIYQNAAQTDSTSVPNTKYSYLDNIRRSLGYPFHDHYSAPVQVIITGENGMDKSTECERANVASLLWSRGISCDYTAQSGLMMSLLKLFTNDIHSERLSFEWSVDMICGICAVFKIPFVVVLVPHLLSSKNAVKLRATTIRTQYGEQYNYAGGDELIVLPSLPSILSERLSSNEDKDVENTLTESNSSSDLQLLNQPRQSQSIDVDCTYVAADQYYDDEHKVKSDNASWKNIKKVMKTSTQKMTTHLSHLYKPMHSSGQSIPVIATDLSFSIIRDVGSCLMLEGLTSLNSSDIAAKYPQHKKVFRTLMYALDHHFQNCSGIGSTSLAIFLYSIPSDKYYLMTLTI